MDPLTNLDRYEFGMRYMFYARAAEVVGIKESTRNYLLERAHFWYIAYCFGKKVAQAECMPMIHADALVNFINSPIRGRG